MIPVDKSISEFWAIGINYKKTDAKVRGQYAINNDQYEQILAQAAASNLKELFILSTCNRTEIYGLSPNADLLVDLLCSQTSGDKTTFNELAYIKNGVEAAKHLFDVSAGLDSQVLGDYEIIGQVKVAAKFSKKKGFIGPFLERLVNSALQASKSIKTNTQLSDGTVSVSFAAIQYIKDNIANYSDKKILLLGVGKIGRNTCKNLVDYLGNKHITLINRSPEKAFLLAEELKLNHAPVEETEAYINEADIIITSTNAPAPIINKQHLQNAGSKLIIDLSIPYNVDADVRELEHIRLMDVDELSKLRDETLQTRKAEIPKAQAIIEEHIAEFKDWVEMRKHVPVLVLLKKKLQQLDNCPIATAIPVSLSNDSQKIQKLINATAIKLKTENSRGCHYIQAINEYIA